LKENEIGRACSTYGGEAYIYIYIYIYRVLVENQKGKKPLGSPERRWKDIKMDLREMG
jgi:hypothetical protein